MDARPPGWGGPRTRDATYNRGMSAAGPAASLANRQKAIGHEATGGPATRRASLSRPLDLATVLGRHGHTNHYMWNRDIVVRVIRFVYSRSPVGPMETTDPLWALIKECKRRGIGKSDAVQVTRQAQSTAERDFGLATEDQILRFIANNGLEKPRLKNRNPLESDPKITAHAYTFCSGSRQGYISFYWRIEKWTIKSFKNNTDPVPSVRPLRP